VNQLAGASGRGVDLDDINFMLSVLKGIKPQNQVETMLAAQMPAVHMQAMRLMRQLALSETLQHQDSAERALNKQGPPL